MTLNISIIYGSTREGRLGIKFAKYLYKEFNKRGNNSNLIDPLELKLNPLVKRYADFEKGSAPKTLEQTHNLLTQSEKTFSRYNLFSISFWRCESFHSFKSFFSTTRNASYFKYASRTFCW